MRTEEYTSIAHQIKTHLEESSVHIKGTVLLFVCKSCIFETFLYITHFLIGSQAVLLPLAFQNREL